MAFTKWGCDALEYDDRRFDRVQAWMGAPPDFWGLYLWGYHREPLQRATVDAVRNKKCRILPIFNRIVEHRFEHTPESIRGHENVLRQHGINAARQASARAREAGIPADGKVRIYADLESQNVLLAWIEGWVEGFAGQYLPGLYGNHRYGWGANLGRNGLQRPALVSGKSGLRIWAAQPPVGGIPNRLQDPHTKMPFQIPHAAAGHIGNLPTNVWQAWHSAHLDVPRHGLEVVDVDLATEQGFAEMF
jgi:glycoside hydrolase-like protein